jgi:hypothetical protein
MEGFTQIPDRVLGWPPSHDQWLLRLYPPRVVPGPLVRDPRPSPVHLSRDSSSPHSLTNSNLQYSPGISTEVESPLRSRGKRFRVRCVLTYLCFVRFDHERPAKRPISLAVEIPQSAAAGAHTPSPLESLQSFSKLPLGSSPVPSR